MHKPDCDTRMCALAGDLIRDVDVAQQGGKELDYRLKVWAVSLEVEKACSILVSDVVIPVVGSEVTMPSSWCGTVARKTWQEQKIDMQNEVVFELGTEGT